jgi:hypothetical protein
LPTFAYAEISTPVLCSTRRNEKVRYGH